MSKDKKDDTKPKDPIAAALGAKGGKARADSLTPERLAEIGKKGAQGRWAPKATHEGVLHVGEVSLPCYNLPDGRRVFSNGGMLDALSLSRGSNPKLGRDRLANFIMGKAISRFISAHLAGVIHSPFPFRSKSGGTEAHGYEATILPDLCGAVIQAALKGALQAQHKDIIERCRLLQGGFATVGIIALVDEATGYQADRARDELQKILAAYVLPDLRPYVPLFPTDFFKLIYKLHGWQFVEGNAKHPGVVGIFINQWIYHRLPSPVLPKLRELNPTNENGRRRHKHHQYLTVDTGLPHLDAQINSVMALMRAANGDKPLFERLLANAYPMVGEQMHLIPGDPNVPEGRR